MARGNTQKAFKYLSQWVRREEHRRLTVPSSHGHRHSPDCQEPAVSTVKRKADRQRPREPNVDPDSPNFSEARTSQATLPARPQAGLPRLLSGKPPLVATSTLLPQAAGGSYLPFPNYSSLPRARSSPRQSASELRPERLDAGPPGAACDNDLQGTNSSGSLGGLDVRRRIPIKLISKQTNKTKPAPRTPRNMNRMPSKTQAGDEEEFDYNKEERYECKGGEMFGNQRRFPGPIFWDYKINLLGEKDDTPVHFCDKCGLPIKMYGRMIPCKHVFCYDCAILHEKKGDKMCPGCNEPVQRIEQCVRGSLFMCSIVQGCKRTYLSQRDLQAHINHRHMRAGKPVTRPPIEPVHPPIAPPPAEIPERFIMPPEKHHMSHIPPKQHIMMPPPPLQHVPHEHYNQPHEDIRAPPAEMSMAPPPPRPVSQDTFRISTRKHSNLITVPIQDDSNSGAREPPPPAPAPAHHHPEYQGQPVVSHPHHIMPPQQHYAPPPPPPPPISHPLQHPPQAAGTPHMVYSQAPPPPMTSAPPPITPPPGHIIAQMPPYMNHPPPGPPPPQHGGPPVNVNAPPPHHYNPNSLPQFSEDQGTLSPPFTQPGGMSPGIWPAPRGPPPPPRMQGPPAQAPLPGPHHPDQARYRPYYQ
ncbi:PREDICTED: E3 ubiquitin-protein ligase Hakai [Haliaeetus leucocephalus]|nr:PREDICTED: E3 ubiquitin-protein ligase Hakai [Haliaeetus leucocephalus]